MPTLEEILQIGWKQHQSGDVRRAEIIYRQVLQAAPENQNAWCFLGMVCHDQARYDDALEAYDRALEIQSAFPVVLSNRGNTLKQLGRFDEAIASCQLALKFQPDYATASNNLGVAYVARGDLESAAEAFEKSISLSSAGTVVQAQSDAEQLRPPPGPVGGRGPDNIVRLDPQLAEAHKNRAIVRLLLGDFERGWPQYEWRWHCPPNAMPGFKQPLWDGSPLQGRTILLVAEQGLGDTLQFVRYARTLQQQGGRVIVAAQKSLLTILTWCPGIDQLVECHGDYPAFDTWAPLVSLPGLTGSTLAAIPTEIPYLSASPELAESWANRLESPASFRVAITWQGSPGFHDDHRRSFPLRLFAALADIPGLQLFSLQKGPGSEQLKELGGEFEVVDFGADLDTAAGSFMDTAAIISNMDLVVSCDSSVPHLAGAMGIETWLALSFSADWRWMLRREDSPWYPSTRLFRQPRPGEWDEVFHRMAETLRPRVQEKLAIT